MDYILVYNDACNSDLYQVENDEFFEGNAELIMYFDDGLSINGLSMKELMEQEPWIKRSTAQPPSETSIPIALLEQF